jgi:hypothetical protein
MSANEARICINYNGNDDLINIWSNEDKKSLLSKKEKRGRP